jgi:hypothetical protein
MTLNGQQFLPGFEAMATDPVPVQPQRSDRYTILRNDRRPAGMRGSIADRAGLPDRLRQADVIHAQDVSQRMRYADSSHDEYDEGAEPHPRTGLPDRGDLSTSDDIGLNPHSGGIPPWASFHESSRAAWAKHGKVQEVPIPTLLTGQGEVSSQRVHELIDNPNTRDARSVRGLAPDLPRVYRNDMGDDLLVDGNHRMTADLLQGRMFGQARVVTSNQRPEMTATNHRMHKAVERAEAKMKYERGNEDFVEKRRWDRIYGSGNW